MLSSELREIVRKSTLKTELSARRMINKWFRDNDESHLWPICNKFNVTERAIRQVRKFERENEMEYSDYAVAIDRAISVIVNKEI